MSVYESMRAYNGIVNHLNKNKDIIDLGKPKKKSFRAKEEYLNNIIIKFGKIHDIKMEKNNSRGYKGNYSPCMSNCIKVQENFPKWVVWIKENYKNYKSYEK